MMWLQVWLVLGFCTMAEEEPKDPRPEIEEQCKPGCVSFLKEYEACVERIQAKVGGHCTGQYFDYYKCIDTCAAPKVFQKIKTK